MTTVIEINLLTNERIERPMTAEELAQWEIDKAKTENEIILKTQAATARQTLLAKLGITEEEAKLLLS